MHIMGELLLSKGLLGIVGGGEDQSPASFPVMNRHSLSSRQPGGRLSPHESAEAADELTQVILGYGQKPCHPIGGGRGAPRRMQRSSVDGQPGASLPELPLLSLRRQQEAVHHLGAVRLHSRYNVRGCLHVLEE